MGWRAWWVLVACVVGCGGEASSSGDESSSSTGDEPSSGTAPPTTSTATTSPTSSADSGSESEGGSESTTGGVEPPMVVGACDEDPATPAGQSGTPTALRTWPSTSLVSAVAIDGAGRRYVTGTFSTTLTFGEQSFEPVVDAGEDEQNDDAFVAGLAPDGTLLWLHHLHGDGLGPRPMTLALDANGFLYVGGEFGSSLWIDGMERGAWPTTGRNAVIAKFTAENGEVRWIRPLTSTENQAMVTHIAPVSTGTVVAAIEWQDGQWSLNDTPPIATIGGTAWLGLDGNGLAKWWQHGVWSQVSWLGNSSMRAIEGGAIATFWTEGFDGMPGNVTVGGTPLSNDSYYASYIVDVGEDGDVRSAEAFQVVGDVIIEDAAVAPCGDLVVVGNWYGDGVDFGTGPLGAQGSFVWRRDRDGNTRWVTAETGEHFFGRVEVDASGQATVSGADDNVGRVTRYATDGTELWKTIVDTGAFLGYPEAIGFTPEGTTVLGGYYYTLAIPGFDPAQTDLEPGAFLLELSP